MTKGWVNARNTDAFLSMDRRLYREMEWDEVIKNMKDYAEITGQKPVGVTVHWSNGTSRGFAQMTEGGLRESESGLYRKMEDADDGQEQET